MFGSHNDGAYALGRLRGEVDRVFSDFFGDWSPRGALGALLGTGVFPPLNIWEDEGGFYVEAELPGLKMEDLDGTVVGNQLTIKGERKAETPKSSTYHRSEREKGTFARVLRVPAEVNGEKVRAALENGVLTVTLPKAEAAKARKIPVLTK